MTELTAAKIIELTMPYVTEARQQRIQQVISKRIQHVSVAVEAPANPHNAAAIIRSAEAFGLTQVHVIEALGTSLQAKATTQGAFHWLDIAHYQDTTTFIDQLHAQGIRIAAASMQGEYTLSELPLEQPICLLFGNEVNGLSSLAQAQCDYLYRIPMVGMSESLNLSVSAAISLYDITQRYRQKLASNSDLTLSQQQALTAQYYLRSIPKRLAANITALNKR
jgi:tRNA (guanosine-2'-O-)-methyltransferase